VSEAREFCADQVLDVRTPSGPMSGSVESTLAHASGLEGAPL